MKLRQVCPDTKVTNTGRVFLKCFLRRNQRKFHRRRYPRSTMGNAGRAVQRNHEWFGDAGGKCLWWSPGLGMRTDGRRWG